jgi:hypothetical protein
MSPYKDVELNTTYSFDDITEDYYSIQKVKAEKQIKSLLLYWNTHCMKQVVHPSIKECLIHTDNEVESDTAFHHENGRSCPQRHSKDP